MNDIIKTEFIKERRSPNSKLKFIIPFVFVLFNILMVSLMGKSPSGKSYIMATSFNWYPILILPIVISLLVMNINNKEKVEHISFQRTMNIGAGKILLAKNIVVLVDLFFILFISSIAIFFIANLFLGEKVLFFQLLIATGVLFVGSFPLIGISFILYVLMGKKFLIILINFLFTFPSAIIAVTNKWILFPWAYNLRLISPVLGLHPNGTFLEANSPLMNMEVTYFGLILSLLVYVLISVVSILIERKKYYV